jgi:DNA-binding GntR family transcriptional regulator
MKDTHGTDHPTSELLRERKSLSQEVAEIIRDSIRSGRLGQGERVVESKLARDLGLSLTPVREAVRQLVGEGILTVSPNRGPSVRILSPDDAYELYSLRGQLEGLAIKLAIRRSTREDREKIRQHYERMKPLVDDPGVSELQGHSQIIHEGIIALSGHARLIAFYASLSLQIALLNRLVARRSNKEHEVRWHAPVIEALFYDDPDAAEAVMTEHIRQSYEAYIAAYKTDQSQESNGITIREWV